MHIKQVHLPQHTALFLMFGKLWSEVYVIKADQSGCEHILAICLYVFFFVWSGPNEPSEPNYKCEHTLNVPLTTTLAYDKDVYHKGEHKTYVSWIIL